MENSIKIAWPEVNRTDFAAISAAHAIFGILDFYTMQRNKFNRFDSAVNRDVKA